MLQATVEPATEQVGPGSGHAASIAQVHQFTRSPDAAGVQIYSYVAREGPGAARKSLRGKLGSPTAMNRRRGSTPSVPAARPFSCLCLRRCRNQQSQSGVLDRQGTARRGRELGARRCGIRGTTIHSDQVKGLPRRAAAR